MSHKEGNRKLKRIGLFCPNLSCDYQEFCGIGREEIEVIFEGDGALEHIDPMFLRPF